MAELFVRIASALGLTALALLFVSLIPFLGDLTAGAGPARADVAVFGESGIQG
jgi:hypothetical protein